MPLYAVREVFYVNDLTLQNPFPNSAIFEEIYYTILNVYVEWTMQIIPKLLFAEILTHFTKLMEAFQAKE